MRTLLEIKKTDTGYTVAADEEFAAAAGEKVGFSISSIFAIISVVQTLWPHIAAIIEAIQDLRNQSNG